MIFNTQFLISFNISVQSSHFRFSSQSPLHRHRWTGLSHTHTQSLVITLLFITPFLLNNNEDIALSFSSASFLQPLALFIASSSKFTEHSSPLSNEEGECIPLSGLVSLCVWARLCLFLYVIINVIILAVGSWSPIMHLESKAFNVLYMIAQLFCII